MGQPWDVGCFLHKQCNIRLTVSPKSRLIYHVSILFKVETNNVGFLPIISKHVLENEIHIVLSGYQIIKSCKRGKLKIFLVPPEEVRIVGDKTVRADRSVSYRCHADNANPAPVLYWTVNGQPTTTGVSTHVHPPPAHGLKSSSTNRRRTQTASDEHLGWSVSSDLTLDVIGDESEIAITCQSVSKDFMGQTMTAKAELKILVLSKCPFILL